MVILPNTCPRPPGPLINPERQVPGGSARIQLPRGKSGHLGLPVILKSVEKKQIRLMQLRLLQLRRLRAYALGFYNLLGEIARLILAEAEKRPFNSM